MERDESGHPPIIDHESSRAGTKSWHVIVGVIITVIAAVMIWVLPGAVGSSWSQVFGLLGEISWEWGIVLTALWIAGLWAFAFVQTAALPGLRLGQAMEMNLAGSAVANGVPGGGALSMGVTAAMMRGWSFNATEIGVFLTLSSAWNLTGRLVFGAIGLGWLVWAMPGTPAAHAGVVGLVVTSLVLLLVVLVILQERWAAAVGRTAGRGLEWVALLLGRHPHYACRFEQLLVEIRREVVETARGRWLRLSLGMTGYVALCCVLMIGCLMALGAPGEPVATTAAIAIERLVTAVPITPGGAGVAELSLVASLNVAGVDATVAVASSLLYRIYTFVLEVPVGIAVAVIWARRRARHQARRQAGHHRGESA